MDYRFDGLIPQHMVFRGRITSAASEEAIRRLLEERKIPSKGFETQQVKTLMQTLANMDTDKDPESVSIGEREGRVFSELASMSSLGFHHGIGRSGDLVSPQPKAPGGSIMYALSNLMARDAIRRFGAPTLKASLVLPCTTGLGIGLALAACRTFSKRRRVVVARVDHRSPNKAVEAFGFEPVVVNGEVVGDAVCVPPEKIAKVIDDDCAAVVSTTTFFPPRESDNLAEIASIASKKEVAHIVNNAYGVQSREIMSALDKASRKGRIDAVVQSTDKNFLCPVGGSIVASPSEDFLMKIAQTYPGRASAAPIAQFLATILQLGYGEYEKLRDAQEANRRRLQKEVEEVAAEFGERVLEVKNPVAVALSLNGFKNPKRIGQKLYSLRVTGPRALEPTDYGVCCPKYICPYLTMNAAIGCRTEDIELAVRRLRKVLLG